MTSKYIMNHPIFVGAFTTLYIYGNYRIYKELSVKNKYIALKYYGSY